MLAAIIFAILTLNGKGMIFAELYGHPGPQPPEEIEGLAVMRFPFVADPVEVRANILNAIGKRSLNIAKVMIVINSIMLALQIWWFPIIFKVYRYLRDFNAQNRYYAQKPISDIANV